MAGPENPPRNKGLGDRYLPGEIRERPAAPETASGYEKLARYSGRVAVEGPELRRSLGRAAVEGRETEIRRALGQRAIQERSDAPERDRG